MSIRGHAAYLNLYRQWRESNKPVGAQQFEPEPAKVDAALEAVTAYVLERCNVRLEPKGKEGAV